MNVSRETIEDQITIGNLLFNQIAGMFIPLRETCEKHSTEWWEYQEMIDRNRMSIKRCQDRITQLQLQDNVSRETSEDHE